MADKKYKATILIVEDKFAQLGGAYRRSLEDNLESCGYFCVTYSTAQEALEEVNNGLQFDAAVADLTLEGEEFDPHRAVSHKLSGEDLLDTIKAKYPHKPVIIGTGWMGYHSRKYDAQLDTVFDPLLPETLDRLLGK